MTAEEKAKIMKQLNDPDVLNEVLQEKGMKAVSAKEKQDFEPTIEVPEIRVTEDMELKDIASQFNAALKTIGEQVSTSVKSSVEHTKETVTEERNREHQGRVQRFAKDHKLMEDDTFLAVMDVHYQKDGDLEKAYETAKKQLNMSEKAEGPDGEKEKKAKKTPVPSSPKSADTGDVDEDELKPNVPPTLRETASKNLNSILSEMDEDPFSEE